MQKHQHSESQLGLLTAPPDRPTASRGLPVLDDAHQRGTTFHEVPVKAILNSPATTGMGFWSLNPYVGCEFGCTYCYARETHKWVVEKAAERQGGMADSAFAPGQHSSSEAEYDAESLTALPRPSALGSPQGDPARGSPSGPDHPVPFDLTLEGPERTVLLSGPNT
ncbi:MAG TPA: hypothetical protein VLD58_11105, partial [Gemmatimonadales bacterium]|nr:hypothetical protein [Gemmatimonadales bacterium]